MQILGLILSGGTGSRMGGADKAFLQLGGQNLVAHVVQGLRPQVTALAISANGDARRFASVAVPVLQDGVPIGPLSGVLAGLAYARDRGLEAVASVAVDTPVFPADLVARLARAVQDGAPAAIAVSNGRAHPTFALWPTGLYDTLAGELGLGHARVMGFADLVGAARVEFPTSDDRMFHNLNTPADLAQANALWPG